MRIRSALTALACTLLAALALAAPSMAATDMAVVASTPVANESAAPSSGRYWVQFTNNVAAVESNTQCVTLLSSDGNEVDSDKYKVSLPDAELEFVYRQYIWIDTEGLDHGASYVIHISGDITAKNGNKLGEDVDIPFTVAAEGASPTPLAEPATVEAGTGGGGGNGSGGNSSTGEIAGMPWQVLALLGLMAAGVVAALIIKAKRYQE